MPDNEDRDRDLREGDRAFNSNVDPLTENEFTPAQTRTEDADLQQLPEVDGARTGDYDVTTGAAHPTADSGADQGVEDRLKNRDQ